MSIADVLSTLESSGIAERIRESLYLFPLIESVHVIGLTMVFGTIAIVDLRLLGIASTRRSFKRVAADVLKWTWSAFALTVATGFLMFITNAAVYYHNSFFRTKMMFLVAVGTLIAAVFQISLKRNEHYWEKSIHRWSVKSLAIFTFLIWVGIIILGRLIAYDNVWGSWSLSPKA